MKISVIIPVYNVKDYIRSCLDSIVTAAHKASCPIECVCVDDGSTDGSGLILDQYASSALHLPENLNLRIVHKNNGGEGSARNAGLDVATGDWLMYCDADDTVNETYFSDVKRALDSYPTADMVRSATASFQDGGKPVWGGDGMLRRMDVLQSLPSEIAMFGVTEMAYRRSRFGDFRFTDHKIGADIVYTNRCFCKAADIVAVTRKNYGYRVRGDSTAHSQRTPRKVQDWIDYLGIISLNYLASGKQIASSLCRGCGSALIEQCGEEIVRHAYDPEWLEVRKQWFKSLKEAHSVPLFTPWQRAVSGVLAVTHSIILARLLCVVPLMLKKKGIHR